MSVTLTRIYTRGGDKGETSLASGQRVSKHNLRIQAIGDIDETNASIGLACCCGSLRELKNSDVPSLLLKIQNDLFDLGADIATPKDSDRKPTLRIVESQVLALESMIDLFNEVLKPLKSFILPGGSCFSAHLHLARTISRRAERSVVCLAEKESVNPFAIQYLNRLSDLLFVLARHGNSDGEKDILWEPGASRETG